MNQNYKLVNKFDQAFHLDKIGRLVEEMENNIRNVMEEIYIKKTKEVIFIINH